MKKDQLIMLDTCVVKYLLNIKGKNDKAVSKNLKEKTLKNYIRHHACCISVFTLFELLRNPLNEQNIKDMKKMRMQIYTPYELELDVFNDDYLNELLDIKKCKKFQENMNIKINKYASDYFARILSYPYVFLLFETNVEFNRRNTKFNARIIADKIEESIQLIAKILLENIQLNNNFSKSSVLKIIEKMYVWIATITFNWFNTDGNQMFIDNDFESVINSTNKLLEGIKNIDLSKTITDGNNNKVKANGYCNLIYVLTKKIKETNPELNIDIENIMIDKNIEIIRQIYKTQNASIEDLFIEKNVKELYLFSLKDKKKEEHPERLISKLFDSNDILDFMGLNLANSVKMPFITTDGKTNEIIKLAKCDITLNKAFIKNI